ncbi:hypothetical protein U9M48_001016 [Paspalum notatum var. saurae]|uniref:PGG domain-containing protein n=1 Tax=Paspalum notatum var. saurae TaxID=547442 RepID=A0AAQ3PFE9_PASNO
MTCCGNFFGVQYDDRATVFISGIHPGICCTTAEVTAERSTLLHIAAGEGHCDLITELCLRDGTLLSSANSWRDTPLHSAARTGHADAVEALVRLARSSVEEDRLREIVGGRNSDGDTALHLAARHGHGEAVEVLIMLAPELAEVVNGAGVSPLYLAVMSGSVRAVQTIVGCANASAAGPMSQNALHAAVFKGSEMVSLLLGWRTAIATDVDRNQSSPLHFAASEGDCSIIQEILTRAPHSAYMQDSDGLSALHAAALMGNGPAVKLLLKFCPGTADIRDKHGKSFLHAASLRGHSSIVSLVTKNRMLKNILNKQDREGNTALHLAVQAGEYKVVSKLLSSGKVHVHIMNNAGHTPSDLIENSTGGFYSMARLVVNLYVHGAQFRPQRQDNIKEWAGQDTVKWRAATSKNLAIVSTLVATVAFSAAFNVPGSYGSDGKATLDGNRIYKAFIVLDTIAMITAVVATILLVVYGRASRRHHFWFGFIFSMYLLWLSVLSMMLGFLAAIAGTSNMKPTLTALSTLTYDGIYILMTLLTGLTMPGSLKGVLRLVFGRQEHLKRRINRQYPLVLICAFNVLLFIVINIAALAAVQIINKLS